MHQHQRGNWGNGEMGMELFGRPRANPQIPSTLALAKQLKLLLGAKSNIFQVLNKHTIKMANAPRVPPPQFFITNPSAHTAGKS